MSAVPGSLVPKQVAVSLRGLTKHYGSVVALHPFDLEIAPGELVVLVGPSGCGKSTVLRLIAGLEDPTAGEVTIGDRSMQDVEPADRDVAMVFQNYALYPNKTVRENLAFGLRMRRRPASEISQKLDWVASLLGLEPLMDRRPAQLSGGQKQRVAFGRAMVREPRVFLFDEPLSNLDARLRADLRREIADLHERLGATMIYVTHDQVEAMTLGERIAVMRGGHLEQCAPPLEIYRRPATLYVATFIGTPAINVVEGELETPLASRTTVRVDAVGHGPAVLAGTLRLQVRPQPAVARVAVAVRAEDLRLGGPAGTNDDFGAVVRRVEQLGNEALVHIDSPNAGGTPWAARVASDWPGRVGERVGVRLERTRLHLFDASTGQRIEGDAVEPGAPW